jgi:predicted transcriptional regulator
MKVRDLMTVNVYTVEPSTPLKIVATRMLEYGVSGMPVVDGDRVVGVVSETDILYKECNAPHRNGLVDWLVHTPKTHRWRSSRRGPQARR